MFKRKPVLLSYICHETAFGSYGDIISKDGHSFFSADGKYRYYMICRGPRIVFNAFNKAKSEINITVQRDVTQFESLILPVDAKYFGPTASIDNIEAVNYPEVRIDLNGGKSMLFANAFEALCRLISPKNDLLILDVLYVGQTEIKPGYLRLDGHSTFAKIADNALKAEPQYEVFIKFLKFDEAVFECADQGCEVSPGWKQHVAAKVGPIPKDQEVCLIEAALISALRPRFNTHHIKGFPNKRSTSYNFFLATCIDELEILISEERRRYRWPAPDGSGRLGNVLWMQRPLKT